MARGQAFHPVWWFGLSRYASILRHFWVRCQSYMVSQLGSVVSLSRWQGNNIFTHPHLGVLGSVCQSSSQFWLFWLLSCQKHWHWAITLEQVSLWRFLNLKFVGCCLSACPVRLGLELSLHGHRTIRLLSSSCFYHLTLFQSLDLFLQSMIGC